MSSASGQWLDPIVNFLIWFWSYLLGLWFWPCLVGLVTLLGFVLLVWFESIPHSEFMRTRRSIDYTTGVESSRTWYAVRSGRFPYLKNIIWRHMLVGTLEVYPALASLLIEGPVMKQELRGLEVNPHGEGAVVKLKKPLDTGALDGHQLILDASWLLPLEKINEKIKPIPQSVPQKRKTIVTIAIRNDWDAIIHDYQLIYRVDHVVEGLDLLYIRLLSGPEKTQTQKIDPRDLNARYEVPLAELPSAKGRRLKDIAPYKIVATFDLEPGITEAVFEYVTPKEELKIRTRKQLA